MIVLFSCFSAVKLLLRHAPIENCSRPVIFGQLSGQTCQNSTVLGGKLPILATLLQLNALHKLIRDFLFSLLLIFFSVMKDFQGVCIIY
jgi:hypothetical protein